MSIEVLTFHAFRSGDRLLLARQVEIEPNRPSSSGGASKEANRKVLHEAASQLGVEGLLERIATVVRSRLQAAYQWPGKTSYAFSLHELTEAGRPTLRAYVTIYLDPQHKGHLRFNFTPRAVGVGGQAIETLVNAMPQESVRRPGNQYATYELRVSESTWSKFEPLFDAALAATSEGWRRASAEASKRDTVARGDDVHPSDA